MKLKQYLQLRGGNNLTNAEARAMGVMLVPGWPKKYENLEIPLFLEQAIVSGQTGPWKEQRKKLKRVADTGQIELQDYAKDVFFIKLEAVKKIISASLQTFTSDPYQAISEVADALEILESIKKP